MRKNSWLSLTLLFLTYFCLGWKLSEFDVPPHLVWFLSVGVSLLLSIVLSFPLRDPKILIMRWLSTDMGTFISIVVWALIAVIIMTWLHLFTTCLVLISAGSLARLDIQVSGFKKWQYFVILATVSLTGLGLGGAIEFLSATRRLVFF